jgi:hypothetical protein
MEERGRRIFSYFLERLIFKFVPNSHDRSFTNLVFAKSYLWMMRGGGVVRAPLFGTSSSSLSHHS